MTEQELSTALLEVRRSYRVVVAYQRRINEIFFAVHEALQVQGYGLEWWAPNHYRRPMSEGEVQFRPQTWAWDLFPGFCLSADWQAVVSGTTRRVWLGLETDSEFPGLKARGGQPDPDLLGPAHESRTDLWLGLYTANAAGLPYRFWQERVWESDLKARWRTAQDQEVTWEHDGVTGTYECRCIPVHQLISEERVRDTLIGPVESWARNHAASRV